MNALKKTLHGAVNVTVLLRTGRAEVHRGPCHCGNGEFVVAWWGLDDDKQSHGLYESSIECRACKKRLSIIERGQQFLLVENVHIEARQDLRNHVLTLREKFMHRADVQDLLRQFAARLDSFQYKSHIYRFLVKHGFHTGVLGPTFVRKWSNGTQWVGRHVISPGDIHKVAVTLGYDETERFDADIDEIELFEAELKVPIPTVGEAIYRKDS